MTDIYIVYEKAPDPEPAFGQVVVVPVEDSDPFEPGLGERLHDEESAMCRFCAASIGMLPGYQFVLQGAKYTFEGLVRLPMTTHADPQNAFVAQLKRAGVQYEIPLDELPPQSLQWHERTAGQRTHVDRARRGVVMLRDVATGVGVYQWQTEDPRPAARHYMPWGFEVVCFT